MLKNIITNLFSFNKMISEQIIKLVYYIGLLGIAYYFLAGIYNSLTSGAVAFLPLLVKSVITAVLAVLVWRVTCEVIVIFFRIYARLGDINKTLGGKNVEAAIPGDEMLSEMRDAALKAKSAAAERAKNAAEKAKSLKSATAKDEADLQLETDLKPAAKTQVVKPKAKTATSRAKTAAKKTTGTTKSTTKKAASTTKKTASKTASTAKRTARKTTTKKT